MTFRLADGNTNDDPTHIPTWDALVKLTGGPGFLYVADCKLASGEAMGHISRGGGRFITVLPRSRKEDGAFHARGCRTTSRPGRKRTARPAPALATPTRCTRPARPRGPRRGGYRIMWVHHSGKQLRDAATRARRIEKGVQAIEDDLAARLSSSSHQAAHERGRARRRRGRPVRRPRGPARCDSP